jgi:lipid-binding SYLF domain-containing protein
VTLIYPASKTKGLFAGVSLEGSAIIERKDANAKFYGSQVNKTAPYHVESEEI